MAQASGLRPLLIHRKSYKLFRHYLPMDIERGHARIERVAPFHRPHHHHCGTTALRNYGMQAIEKLG